MKLPGWEKVTSAECYRQMIEAEYYRLHEQRAEGPGAGVGLEEIRLRLFLSLIEKPAHSEARPEFQPSGGVVHTFPLEEKQRRDSLLNNNQPASDQAA